VDEDGVLSDLMLVHTDEQRRRCFRCGNAGHVGQFCRAPGRSSAAPPSLWSSIVYKTNRKHSVVPADPPAGGSRQVDAPGPGAAAAVASPPLAANMPLADASPLLAPSPSIPQPGSRPLSPPPCQGPSQATLAAAAVLADLDPLPFPPSLPSQGTIAAATLLAALPHMSQEIHFPPLPAPASLPSQGTLAAAALVAASSPMQMSQSSQRRRPSSSSSSPGRPPPRNASRSPLRPPGEDMDGFRAPGRRGRRAAKGRSISAVAKGKQPAPAGSRFAILPTADFDPDTSIDGGSP
jgi:hypothetical protein